MTTSILIPDTYLKDTSFVGTEISDLPKNCTRKMLHFRMLILKKIAKMSTR